MEGRIVNSDAFKRWHACRKRHFGWYAADERACSNVACTTALGTNQTMTRIRRVEVLMSMECDVLHQRIIVFQIGFYR